MKNQEHNNNLDQLFNKAKADKQGLDDFEKDAFAGFETLGSEQEAKDLKAALDTRINKELFNKEEKNNPKIYWLAAAGLALVIGLTALFVVNNNDAISKNSDLAISNVEQKTEEKISLDSKKELKEETVAPTETAATEQSPPKEEPQKTVAEELKKEEPAAATKALEQKEMTSRMIVPALKSETAKDGQAESEKEQNDQTERRKENVATGNSSKNSDDGFAGLDDLAKNDKSNEKVNSDRKAVNTIKSDQNKQVSEESDASVKDEVVVKENKKGKLDEKSKESDKDLNFKQPVVLGNNNTNAGGRETGKSKSRAKKSAETQSSMAGPVDVKNSPGSPKTTTTNESAGEINVVPVQEETKPLEATYNNCYYTGGEPAITKDLKEKLNAENLDQKFDAILYISEKKTVEKIEFTNAYDLTKKQKEDVTKILKSLNKFNVPATGKKESFTYKLLYRP